MAYDKRKMQDIKYSEKYLWSQYKQEWANGNIDGIKNLLQNNPQLKYKIFDSFNWNRLINNITDRNEISQWDSTKTYNDGDIVFYLGSVWASQQSGNTGNAPSEKLPYVWGKVAYTTDIGDEQGWDSTKIYSVYDIVASGSWVYVSKKNNNKGNKPLTSPTYWQKLYYSTETPYSCTYDSLSGKWKIDYKPLENMVKNFAYIGIWQEGNEYTVGNVVKFNDRYLYFCIQGHTSYSENIPPNLTYWLEATKMMESAGLQVSSTPPTNLLVGDIYFQIVN